HQTLKAALDWSYERLNQGEQTVLQRLSVFKMSFTLEAAIGVSSCELLKPDQLATLVQRLVAKSLLSMDQVNGTTRYRLLNTTRTYA
ncbi:transcriptional regulator, partial [Pseudomonas sp. GW247-3R2A]